MSKYTQIPQKEVPATHYSKVSNHKGREKKRKKKKYIITKHPENNEQMASIKPYL